MQQVENSREEGASSLYDEPTVVVISSTVACRLLPVAVSGELTGDFLEFPGLDEVTDLQVGVAFERDAAL